MTDLLSATSPTALLARFRGPVTRAQLTYADMARLEVIDAEGGVWEFGTWYADYSPTDPGVFLGRTVISAGVDEAGVMTIGFSDGTPFSITPIPDEEDDAIENWKLFTPEGLVLDYGPWSRWNLKKATDPC